MQPLRVFVFTGLLSSFIQSLLVLLVLAKNISIVRTAAPIEEANVTAPLYFPEEGVRSFDKAKVPRISNSTEAYDMQTSSVSKADATVDPEDEHWSVPNESVTETPAASGTQMSTVTSSTPSNDSNATEPVPASGSLSSTANNPTSLVVSTSSTVPATTETATTMPVTSSTATTSTTLSTTSQMDTGKNNTAKALAEDSGGMPTGVVALVTMITFAIIAVLAYVSLIVWRRYLEYRYGNRELLVNDLEFDTNDLRHFEL